MHPFELFIWLNSECHYVFPLHRLWVSTPMLVLNNYTFLNIHAWWNILINMKHTWNIRAYIGHTSYLHNSWCVKWYRVYLSIHRHPAASPHTSFVNSAHVSYLNWGRTTLLSPTTWRTTQSFSLPSRTNIN